MKTKRLHVGATAGGMPPGAMQTVLDALDCQIAVLTASGDVVLVNEAWRKMAESDVPSATHVPRGQNYLQASQGRGAKSREARQALAGVHAVLARRTTHFSLEYPSDARGRKRWFQMKATACDISGSPHAVVVLRPIAAPTALKERPRIDSGRLVSSPQREEQRETEDELRALLARKEEFLATLVHELRNPLAPIVNALEILGHNAHDPQSVARARGVIQRQLRQVTRLVDDLFDISRIKRERVETQRARVDIADVIPVAIEAAQPLVDLRRHTLTATIAPHHFIVHADATRLAQVLTNLLINAAKYTPPGGHISIVAERSSADVLVHVRDSGVGIAREHIGQVFELFAQAAPTPETRRAGLGIGLALARELMRLQGGSITVQSEGPGRGSQFTISLPGMPDSAEQDA